MENTGGRSTAKTVMLIFAILFSIAFVPVLIVFVPFGGGVTSLMDMASKESIEKMVDDSGVAEELYEMLLQEAVIDETVSELNSETFERVLRNSVQAEDVDAILDAFVDGIYSGNRVDVDLSEMEESLKESIRNLCRDGFDDLYNAWRNDTPSDYFSEEFCEELFEEIESDVLADYSMYGVSDVDALETLYDAEFGEGAFSKVLDEEIDEIKAEWDKEVDSLLASEMDGMATELEEELEGLVYETAQDSDVRELFDIIEQGSRVSGTVKIIVFAVIFGMVLFLLALYLFDVVGFVVTAVPLAIGGLLCKLLAGLDNLVLGYMEREVFDTMNESEEVINLVRSLIEGILKPFFSGVSNFGNVVLIAAVILIGCAILRGVINKNKREAEATFM